jgi:hypothetical protein
MQAYERADKLKIEKSPIAKQKYWCRHAQKRKAGNVNVLFHLALSEEMQHQRSPECIEALSIPSGKKSTGMKCSKRNRATFF